MGSDRFRGKLRRRLVPLKAWADGSSHLFLVGLFILATALAGCSKPGESPMTSSSSIPPVTTTTTDNPTPGGPLPIPMSRELQMTNCTSWYALAEFPVGAGPGQTPPGWSPPSPTSLVTTVADFGYHCNRVSVGPYERGPVNLLFDTHNNASFPGNCTSNPQGGSGSTSFLVMAALFIDDSDIAGFLKSRYGIPAQVATFSMSDQPIGGATVHRWGWASPQGKPSSLTIYDDQKYATVTNTFDRFFWPRNDGIGVLEVDENGDGPAGPFYGRAVNGTMQPPMLLSALPGGTYAGDGKWFPTFHSGAKFALYKDRLCQQPEL